MYEHVRTWQAEGFRLDLWKTGRRDEMGKEVLRYALFDYEQPFGQGVIFEGEDFCCSPLHGADSDAVVATLLSFLSLRESDTDSEYFDRYTERQLEWRDSGRAELLSLLVRELEEAADSD